MLYDPEDKLFKCWYTVYHDNEYRKRLPGSYMVCYATSKDGYVWQKPELNLVEWMGSRKNNFIRLGQKYVSAITVVLAPPGSGIQSRYVAAYLDAPDVYDRAIGMVNRCASWNFADWIERRQSTIPGSVILCAESLWNAISRHEGTAHPPSAQDGW